MGCRSLNSVGGPGEAEPWAGRFLKNFLKLLEIANQPISPKFKPCPSRIGSSSSGGGGIFFLSFSNTFKDPLFKLSFTTLTTQPRGGGGDTRRARSTTLTAIQTGNYRNTQIWKTDTHRHRHATIDTDTLDIKPLWTHTDILI